MKLEIGFDQIRDRYPNEIRQVMQKLAKGRSKHRGAAPEDLRWFLDWCVAIGCSKPAPARGRVPSGISVGLSAEIGQWRGCSDRITPVPDEVRDVYENPPAPPPIPEGALTIVLLNDGASGKRETVQVLGGYWKRDRSRRPTIPVIVTAENTLHCCYRFLNGTAYYYTGALFRARPSASTRPPKATSSGSTTGRSAG